MTARTIFAEKNAEILKAKGPEIPLWLIGDKLGVHENTVRNWMRREMTNEKKEKILAAIAEIKQELAKAQ